MKNLSLDSLSVLLFCSDLLIDETEPISKNEWIRIEYALNELKQSPAHIFGLNETALSQTLGLDEYVVCKVLNRMNKIPMLLHTINALNRQGIDICTKYESDYPKNLRALKINMPLYFYFIGTLSKLDKAVSVEGVNLNKKNSQVLDLLAMKLTEEDRVLICSDPNSYLFKQYLALDKRILLYVKDNLLEYKRKYNKRIENEQMMIISTYDPYSYSSSISDLTHQRIILGLSDYQLVMESPIDNSALWQMNTLNARQKLVKQMVFNDEHYGGNKQLITMGLTPFDIDDLMSVLNLDFIYKKNINYLKEQNKKEIDQLDIFEFID